MRHTLFAHHFFIFFRRLADNLRSRNGRPVNTQSCGCRQRDKARESHTKNWIGQKNGTVVCIGICGPDDPKPLRYDFIGARPSACLRLECNGDEAHPHPTFRWSAWADTFRQLSGCRRCNAEKARKRAKVLPRVNGRFSPMPSAARVTKGGRTGRIIDDEVTSRQGVAHQLCQEWVSGVIPSLKLATCRYNAKFGTKVLPSHLKNDANRYAYKKDLPVPFPSRNGSLSFLGKKKSRAQKS